MKLLQSSYQDINLLLIKPIATEYTIQMFPLDSSARFRQLLRVTQLYDHFIHIVQKPEHPVPPASSLFQSVGDNQSSLSFMKLHAKWKPGCLETRYPYYLLVAQGISWGRAQELKVHRLRVTFSFLVKLIQRQLCRFQICRPYINHDLFGYDCFPVEWYHFTIKHSEREYRLMVKRFRAQITIPYEL